MVNSYISSVAGVFKEVEGSAECPKTVMGDMSSQDTYIIYVSLYNYWKTMPSIMDSLVSKVLHLQ